MTSKTMAGAGVTELGRDEAGAVTGGWMLAVALAVGAFVVTNWKDIEQGAMENWGK